MLPGTFYHKLQKLNPYLRILSNGIRQSLYIVDGCNAPLHLCGVDRNDIPEFTIYDKKGHIIKAGWRRTVEILIFNKLVKRNLAEKIFSAVFDKRNSLMIIEDDPIDKAIAAASTPSRIKNTKGIDMKKNDVMDISKMIRGAR